MTSSLFQVSALCWFHVGR